jgi:hypothetical protein
MKALARSLFLVVAWAASCGLASGFTLVVNCTTVASPTELNANVVCSQFNLTGQTLTSISISISGGITGNLTLTNGSTTTQTMVETTSAQFSVGALSGFTFVNPVFSASFTTGNRSLNAGQTLTVAGLSANGSGTLGTNTTSFAPYVGAGAFTIHVSTATTLTGTGGGGFPTFSQATNANATATVTYTSSP